MLLYLWLILTIPQDRVVCSLWISKMPTTAALVQTCGTDNISPYRLDVKYNDVTVCTQPAQNLFTIMADCALSGTLGDYRFVVVEPNYQTSLCAVSTTTNTKPTNAEIDKQCPAHPSSFIVEFWGTRKATETTQCKPPAPTQPASIATSHELHLLAGKLIWYGYIKPNCPQGVYSAPLTPTPCALDASRSAVYDWQNSMDAEILQAANEWNVPALTLKQMIENESQFWGWTNSPEEHGLIQATDYAAFAVLHVYERGYYALTPSQRASARAAWLAQLDCPGCDPKKTIEHAKRNMSRYAQTLAAYYCMYGSWPDALRAWNIKYTTTTQ
jgi:hypothetical protein